MTFIIYIMSFVPWQIRFAFVLFFFVRLIICVYKLFTNKRTNMKQNLFLWLMRDGGVVPILLVVIGMIIVLWTLR